MTDLAKLKAAAFVEKTIIEMVRNTATMREIAKALTEKGFIHSRSAVAGKIKRLRDKKMLPQGIKVVEAKSPSTKTVSLSKKFIPNRSIKGASIRAKQEKYNTVNVENKNGIGIPFLKVKNNECKWIMDYNRNGQKMCCGEMMYHRSFCKQHYFVCYEAPIGRRARVNPKMVDRNVHDVTQVLYTKFFGDTK
jgi:hypothetical protein